MGGRVHRIALQQCMLRSAAPLQRLRRTDSSSVCHQSTHTSVTHTATLSQQAVFCRSVTCHKQSAIRPSLQEAA